MTQQTIDIGIQGNDGTGDSIRDSFRKVNENFTEIYSIFGQGGTIKFTNLSDTPSSYTGHQIFITQGNPDSASSGILAKTLKATSGVSLSETDTTITIVGTQSNLKQDDQPTLGNPLNANSLPIGNLPDPSQAAVNAFNAAYASKNISTTIDKLAISKGYADTHYVQANSGNAVSGPLFLRDEPITPQISNADYDGTLTGNYLAHEALPRKNVVYRGGDTMTGKLTLSDHPGALAGSGTPNGSDDLQAATKYYVDNNSFTSGTNLFVSTGGDDTQLKTPAGKEGRSWAHAYRTVGAAALQAQTLIALASQEPGPYRQKIAYTINPNEYFSTITNVSLSGGNSSVQGFIDASALLQANRTFIQAETIAYVNNKYVNVFSYNQAKCARDVGTVLNAVGTDLVLNTNFNALLAGTAYYDTQAANVVNSQLVQTIDGIEYAKKQVLQFSYNSSKFTTYFTQIINALNLDMLLGSNYQSITAALYFSSAATGLSVSEFVGALQNLQTNITALSLVAPVSSAVTSLTNNINTIITIIEGGTVPAISVSTLAATTAAQSGAATLLLNNLAFIEAEITAYLAANFSSVSYNQIKSRRDIGLVVQAVAYDQLYGGNSATIYAGQQYWYNNVSQIATGHLAACKAALSYVNTLAQACLTNNAPAQVYQNSVIQYQNATYAAASSRGAVVANLLTIVSGNKFNVTATNTVSSVLTATSTANMSVGMPITFGAVSSITLSAYQSVTGSGPYAVKFVIPTQTTAPVVGTSFTVAGNSNSNFNGVFTCTASSLTSITLSYVSNPGTYGSGTTTVTPFLGGLVSGTTYYVTAITDGTHFTVSTTVNGSSPSLTTATMAVTATYAGIISANVPPSVVPVTTANGPSSLQPLYTQIGTPSVTTTLVSNSGTYLNNTYPYISNDPAITAIKADFAVVTNTLSGGLANRPTMTFNAPSSLNVNVSNAATLLSKNYAFVQAELLGWIKANYPSFAYVASNGDQLFSKDIQTLTEGLVYDMVYGGNSGVTNTSNQFWYINTAGNPTSTIDSSESGVKLLAIAYAQTLLSNVAGNSAPGSAFQQYITNYATYVKTTGASPWLVTLNIPTRVIPLPVGTLVTVAGNSNTSFNTTVSVVASTASTVTLSYPSNPGVWSNVTQTSFKIAQFIDAVNYPVTGTAYSTIITTNWGYVQTIIGTNVSPTLVTPDLTNSVYAGTGYLAVRNTIASNATTIGQSVVTYLNATYKGGFSYNQSTCYRDVGLIIDAMSIDLLTGGTYQSINAGKSYFKNSSAKSIAIGTQYTETYDALLFSQALALQVLNQTTASRYQLLTTQTLDSSKNAVSGYTATATVASYSASTPSVTVNSSSGILVGMIITGTGFISSQVVTAINGNVLTLSAAADTTPSGTLTFTLTAVTTFNNNYNTMVNIVKNGVGSAPTPSFGTGIYTISFTNGGNGFVDQGTPGDVKILAGKILQGITSNATANILTYSAGGSSNVDTITCQLTQPGFFQSATTTATGTQGSYILTVANATGIAVGQGISGSNIPLSAVVTAINGTAITISVALSGAVNGTVIFGEQLQYAESVANLQITIQVESGIYYEDYPIKIPANVSVRGDEFRRTIIRPIDRVSQSPWVKTFFYRDSVIDGLTIGPINTNVDYAPTTAITSYVSKTGTGPYYVTFNIPTQTTAPSTSITYTVSGNSNLAYNGVFTCASSSTGTITLSYPSDPGVYSTATTSYITPLVSATLTGVTGNITITLSGNTQAQATWLGYVFQSDVLDSNGKPGQAVITSVSGNYLNATVMYPFSILGTINITPLTGTFQVGEVITQTASGASGKISSIGTGSIVYTPIGGTFVSSSNISGLTSGATASVNSVALSTLAPSTWHLYVTNNYGRHYLVDPTDITSTPKNNKDIDVFLMNDAGIIRNITGQGHGGFMMVLDPEGQIKSKSPYGQVCTSFSKSINAQTFAGGQFIDGFTGRLFGTITNVSVDGYTVTVTGGINSGLDVRAPQAPCAFYVTGNRYQIDTISSYSQTFDANGNVIGGVVTLTLGVATPWLNGAGQAINIEMGGNKSMLANDYAQVNDLGYAILATNGGITEQVSTFTYYCWTAFWALNGGQIRSVGSSSAHGQYALRASGYDVTELPDSVNLANNLVQTAKIFNPTNLPQSSQNNQFYGNMNTGAVTVYIVGYDYFPTNICELEIDHSLAGKGIVRYQVNSISHSAIYVPTGASGDNYAVVSVTYNPSGSSGTTLVVSSTTGVAVGMTVRGTGFTLGQQVTAIGLDGVTLTLNGAPDSTPSGTLYIGDTITVSGASLGGTSSTFTANTTISNNQLSSVSSLAAVISSPAILVTGYVSKTGTGPYLVTFNIPTQGSSPSLTNYTVAGCTNTGYNGSITASTSTTSTITLSYPSDPGTFSNTNAVTLMPVGTTVTSYNNKTGSAPNVLVTLNLPYQAGAPLVGGSFTIKGNSNANYNGTFVSTASNSPTFSATMVGSLMTVTGVSSGSIYTGMVVLGTGVPGTTTVSSFGTGTGGVGTYNVSTNTAAISSSIPMTGSMSTVTLRYTSDPGTYGTGTTTITFNGSFITGPNIPFGTTALTTYNNNTIILSNVATATASGNTFSSNGGNDITAYATGLTNTSLSTFTYTGNAISGGSGTYNNVTSTGSSGFGTYANFNVTVANGVYTSVTLGGQNVLLLNLGTSGAGGTSSTGLAAPVYDGQLVEIRVLQNLKFFNVNNVNPTRPSTALQFTDNLSSIYRVLAYNLAEATNEQLPAHTAILSTDTSFNYYLFQADPNNISLADPIDGGGKTMGATPGDTRIAVNSFGPQSSIDQVNKGIYAFAWGGRVHTVSSYTPPVTTTIYTGYNPTGSSGTTLVVGGTFTGNTTNNSATLSNISSFTGLVIGEVITGANIPAGTTILSINTGASTIGMSATATATATGTTVTYGGTTGILANMSITGSGFNSSQYVVSVSNSTTLIISAAPNSTPSGSIVFTKSTVPYITLGATKYNIAGTNTNSVTTLLEQSRGQVAATYYPTGNITGNTTSGSAVITGVSSLNNIGAGTSVSGTGIPSLNVVTATATTASTATTTSSSINSSGVFTVGSVSSGTVAVGMTLSGVGVSVGQTLTTTAASGTGSTATLTLSVANPTITASGSNLLTVNSTSGLSLGMAFLPTAVTQSTNATATTNALATGSSSTISGTTFTVGGSLTYGLSGAAFGSISGTSIAGAATYTAVASTGGSGTGATFTVTKTGSGTTYTGVTTITTVAAGTGYVVGDTITIAGALLGGATPGNNLTFTVTSIPSIFQVGMVLTGSTVTAGTYIVSNIAGSGSGSTWVVSTSQNVSNTAITGAYNAVTVNSTTGMLAGESIIFTGTGFGNLVSATTYYITRVVNSTSVCIGTTYGATSDFVVTGGPGNPTTGSMTVNAGSVFGGLTTGTTYYIISISGNQIGISTSYNGSALSLTNGVGAWTALAGYPFVSGSSITVAGLTPTGYNGTYTVTGSTINTVSFASSTTGSQTVAGTVTSIPVYITSNISGSGAGSTWQTSVNLAVSSTTIVGTNSLVTIGATSSIAVGNSLVFDGTAGAVFGGIVSGQTYYVRQIINSTQFTMSTAISGPASVFTTASGSIVGRTDCLVLSTNTGGTFTGTITNGSAVITAVSTFGYIVVGAGISGVNIPANTTVVSYNVGASTITMSNQATFGATETITYTSNTIILSANATATNTTQYLTFNNLSTSIVVYTSDRTQYITAGMTVFGNGFTGGQTVISATASSTGTPLTTIVLSGVPNSTPFGVLGFTQLSSAAGPWYETFTIATQASAPIVDCFYYIGGNSVTKYNGWQLAVASTTNSITFAYTVDPASTVVSTYNPSGSSGTTLKVSSTSGIVSGMLVRGGGTGGFFAGQTVASVVDGVTVTLSAAPAGTPSGNITFFNPYGSGTTTFTANATGISRPMNNTVSSALRAGYLSSTFAQITTRISTCRCSAHDLLDIGTGGYNTTNYPYQIYGNPFIKATQTNEVKEETVGRVFYVTTDQNGIFRVGRFFTVDQGTGTVTFSASIALSNLDGLGFKRGVVVSEFSTDSTMTNDASDTVPVQSAVRSYIDNRLGIQHSGATTPATALIGSGYMALNGQLPMKNNMSMGGYIIGSMGSPILSTDAANKLYVDTGLANVNAFYKLNDVSIGGATAGNLAVYNGVTSKWNNASFDKTSDVMVSFDGTTLLATIQGAVITTTYQGGGTSSSSMTVTSTAGIIPGMIITGTGFSAGQYVVSVTNSTLLVISAYAAGGTPVVNTTTLTFTRDGAINNGKVSASAAIAQSKLAMNIAGTLSGNPTGTSAQIQAASGLASFDSTVFNVTNGWVTFANASSNSTGLNVNKISWIASGTVLANITGATAAVSAVSTASLVLNGDGVRNQDIGNTVPTGAVLRTGVKTYDVVGVSTTGSASSLVKTTPLGAINVQGIQISNYPSTGNLIDVTGTSLNLYTPGGPIKFITATGSSTATVTYYGLQDFTQTGTTLQSTTLSTGASSTAGSIVGQWSTGLNSQIDFTLGTLKSTTLTTGADATGGVIQGTWTLHGSSKLQATYADLAEYYTSDKEYEPGTVVIFGGDAETTTTKVFGDSRVAGVVTTAPAYIMNSELEGMRVCIALIGRVPVKVLGPIKKGDLITTASVEGFACKAINPQLGTIIGKALENKDSAGFGVIEVAVGRM